jgi:hypothetical protein
MRTLLILSVFAASLADAAWRDYQETRELSLDASGITSIDIDAGAGSLEVRGDADADAITVSALIRVPARSDEKAKKIIESDLRLSLDRSGDKAVLNAYFESGAWSWGDSPTVSLEVNIPKQIGLEIDDGSGSVKIWDVTGNIEIDDGSGSLTMNNVGGDIRIEDGSGSVSVDGVGGDISIDDGSGSITVRNVRGSVIVDDGSGGINISDVDADLIIEDDGSGSLNFARINGQVQKKD